jgi:hypothetical protein
VAVGLDGCSICRAQEHASIHIYEYPILDFHLFLVSMAVMIPFHLGDSMPQLVGRARNEQVNRM